MPLLIYSNIIGWRPKWTYKVFLLDDDDNNTDLKIVKIIYFYLNTKI